MFKKFIATAAALLLGVGLSVIAVAAPASATSPTYPPTGNVANDPDNWEVLAGETCIKLEPVTTVPYILGAAPAGREWSKVIVKTGSGDDANTVYESGLVAGAPFQHATKDSISHLILCTTPLKDSVDCEAATVVTGVALTNGDHINMTITQDGSSFQTNAYIDIRQAQDPASESGLVVRITQKSGPQVVLPITNAQKASGVFTFEYAKYLTGTWTVTWVQYDSHDEHFNGALECGTDLLDAAATVTLIPATCVAPGSLTLNTATWADWADYTSAVGPYSVVATAKPGHAFAPDDAEGVIVSSDGKTKTFTGTVEAQKTGLDCVDPKVDFRLGVCTPKGEEPNRFSTKDLFITLDNRASDEPVTFTIAGAKDVAGADPTADIVRTVPAGESVEVQTAAITTAGGSYVVTFAAPGEDIPNQTITVPSFEGCLDGQPGDPSHTNQQCVYGEVTEGSITVLPLEGFRYTIDGPDGFHQENVGETTTGLEPGTYTVTVTALPGYVLTGPEKWPYEIVIEEAEHCEELPVPVVPTAAISCDAAGSYTLPAGDGYDWYLGDAPLADGVHTVTAAGSFTVTARVVDSTYGFPGGVQQVEFPLTFIEPVDCVTFDAAADLTVKPATCFADGYIDQDTIVLENADWSAPLPTAPGNHTVTAVAIAGHAFPEGATSKVFEIVIPAMLPDSDPACQLPDLAIVTPTFSTTPMTCTAAGSFTIGAVDPGTVNWSIDGGAPTTGGTFPVSTAKSISLVATPVNPEDGLDENWPYTEENPLVLTFAASTANCDLATLAYTGVGGAAQLGLLGALLALTGVGAFLLSRRVRQQR